MDIKEVRLGRLHELLAEHDGSKKALAHTLRKAPAQVSQWFNRVRTVSEESAREIERLCKRPRGWMDNPPLAMRTSDAPANTGTVVYAREPDTRPPWPFSRIDERKLARLSPEELRDFEAAVLGVAAALGLQIGKRRAA